MVLAHKSSPAFLLQACMVYLASTLIILTTLFASMQCFLKRYGTICTDLKHTINKELLLDVIARDLAYASCKSNDWVNQDTFLVRSLAYEPHSYIRWHIDAHGTLLRTVYKKNASKELYAVSRDYFGSPFTRISLLKINNDQSIERVMVSLADQQGREYKRLIPIIDSFL